jgi:uncharacterized OB-fold protein
MSPIPTISGLTTTVADRQHLIAARCPMCDTCAFPVQLACPRCGATTEQTVLPTTGTVWTWTVQRIQPKPPYRGPDEWEPFALAYVDLGVLRVETRLAGKAADAWRVGDAVHLIVGEAGGDGSHWSFWFEADPS